MQYTRKTSLLALVLLLVSLGTVHLALADEAATVTKKQDAHTLYNANFLVENQKNPRLLPLADAFMHYRRQNPGMSKDDLVKAAYSLRRKIEKPGQAAKETYDAMHPFGSIRVLLNHDIHQRFILSRLKWVMSRPGAPDRHHLTVTRALETQEVSYA